MELSAEVAEKIISGTLGLLSFIGLIVYLRWMGTPEDQKKPSETSKESNANQE